jgi:lipopolysaccharide transport system ATP-binding protein
MTRDAYISGQPLEISISYNAHHPINDAVVGIRITDIHGHPVWGTNTRRRGVSIPRILGAGSITYAIPELPLLEGTYELTVALSDLTEVHAFDHWERRVRFNVHQHATFDEGIVLFEGAWLLNSDK